MLSLADKDLMEQFVADSSNRVLKKELWAHAVVPQGVAVFKRHHNGRIEYMFTKDVIERRCAMPSKNGVFYELKESPYSFMYGDCTFFFSSRKHLSSFMDKICVRTQWLDDSMEKRFHFYVNMQLVAAFQLYFTVETRGCYVRLENGEELTCRENLRLNGLKASVRASTPQSESTTTPFDGLCGRIPPTPSSCPSR